MVPPRSPLAAALLAARCPCIHSVISPTTGSAVGPNSVELAPGDAGQVARRLDHRHLHAEADAEIRHVALAGELRRLDLALGAALAEAAGHQDAVDVLQERRAASSRSKISLSIQSRLTLTLLAMPPWVSASISDL